jgi:hypothetical protein
MLYDQWLAFHAAFGERLPKDAMRIIQRYAGVDGAAFAAKLEQLQTGTLIYLEHSNAAIRRLDARLREEQFEWGLIARFGDGGWGMVQRVHQERQFNEKKGKVLAAHLACEDAARVQRGEIARRKNRVRAVRALLLEGTV